MALGAKPGQVLGLVIRKGLVVTTLGILSGGVLCAFLTRVIASISLKNSGGGVHPKLLIASSLDPLIYIAAASVLCALALLACWLPARRAARINPTEALRIE